MNRHERSTPVGSSPTASMDTIMDARDREFSLLRRCAEVARGESSAAHDAREANVFRLASMIMHTHPEQEQRWAEASAAYFAQHPDDLVPTEQIIRRGWIFSLPRFRDMITPML